MMMILRYIFIYPVKLLGYLIWLDLQNTLFCFAQINASHTDEGEFSFLDNYPLSANHRNLFEDGGNSLMNISQHWLI